MDHHRHHPPQPIHHLHDLPSRYGPLPPRLPSTAPVFLDHDPYRRQPHLSFPPPPPPGPLPRPPPPTTQHHHHHHHHQHHPTDDGGIVYVSYAPSSNHASDHGRFLVPADTPDLLVFKPPPHPPAPATLRVSDRIIFPDGHPEAPRLHPHGRRSGGGEVFLREDVKRERVLHVFDDGQQIGLPYGPREAAVTVELGEQEDFARRVALLGSKRPRWEEDRVVLREDALIERFEGRKLSKRDSSSGSGTSHRRCEGVYDPRAVGAEPSRGLTSMFTSERGEAAVTFPRLPAEAPLRSSGHSISKLGLLENSKMMESKSLSLGSGHGFCEKHFTSRAKRNFFLGEENVHALQKKAQQQEDVHSLQKKAQQQKPSVLSRIQFAKPVRKRKHEQQIISSASPLPMPQSSAFLGCDQLEIGGPVELDVSFKSDVLVAKEMVTSPGPAVSRSVREAFGAKTTKRNMAKDTSVSPSTSFPRPVNEVTVMRTHKMKSSEDMFAHSNPDKGRTLKRKVANKSLVSLKNVLRTFDGKVAGSRMPRNKVANEVTISSNRVQHPTNRVFPVTTTEKKMTVKIVAPPDSIVQDHDGKFAFTTSPKGKPSKEALVPQINVMPNPDDGVPTLKSIKNLSSDGVISTETCAEDNLASEVLDNCIDVGPNSYATDNNTGSTGKKLEKETLAIQTSTALLCNEKVAILKDPNKEVSEDTSFPLFMNAEENDIIEKPEKIPGNNSFTSSSSAVNSDKKVTVMRMVNMKVVKRSKKKKVIASIAPCSPRMDPPGEICKGHEPTNSSPKGTDSSKDIKLGDRLASSIMEQKILEEGKKGAKHSETVRKVLPLDSSSKLLKHLEDVHARFVSRYPEGMASPAVRSIKKKLIRRRNNGEVTLIPRTLDSYPTQEMCEKPFLNSSAENKMHSKEVLLGSLLNPSGKDFNCSEGAHSDESHKQGSSSNCFQEDLNFSEGAHKDALWNKVLQNRLDAAEVQSGSLLTSSCEHVEHLKGIYDASTQTSACVDADFPGKGHQHILSGSPDDLTYSVLAGEEISDKQGADSSTLKFDSQGIVSPGHLKTNTTEIPSTAVVPMEVDVSESSNEKDSVKVAVENFRSSVLHEGSRAEGDVNFWEGSGGGKQLSAIKEISLSDVSSEKIRDEVVTFFDGDSSPKADISLSKKEGEQKVTPRSQASALVEKHEVVHNEKCASIFLDSQMQESSIALQVGVQPGIPESEKEIKQKNSPAQGVFMTAEKLGKLRSEGNIVGRERSRVLQPDMYALPMEAQGAVLDHSYLMITHGQEGNTLQYPFVNIYPESNLSVIEVECPILNSMNQQVSDKGDSFFPRVSEKNSPEDSATVSEEMHLAEVKQTVSDLLDNKSCHDRNIVGSTYEDSNSKNGSLFDSKILSGSEPKISGKSELTDLPDFLVSDKALLEPMQEAEKLSNRSHQVTCKEQLTSTKVCQKAGVNKTPPCQTILSTRSFKKPPSHNIRRNTWHRMESPPLSLSSGHIKWPNGGSFSRQSPKKLGKFQSSYIRKGNSLIRKSSSVVPLSFPCPEQTALDQLHGSESNKNMSIDDKIDGANRVSFSNAKTLSSSFERPKTPPITLNKSTQSVHPSLNFSQTLIEDPLSGRAGGDHAIPSVATPCSHLNEENHRVAMAKKSKVSDRRSVIYVKHRSNQLVAAPGTDANNASVHSTEESKVFASGPHDLYYRNKNKLIRDTSSVDGHFKQEPSLPNGISDASCCQSFKMTSLKGGDKVPRKTRRERAVDKTCKQSRFSLVWTLNGAHPQSNKGSHVLKDQKVLPYLFPWKRTAWRSLFTKMRSNSIRHGSSLIKKLQLSRQRGAIYTISNSGFSLRKSGVLGIGGSNLKWSKSMERRSRKASEEATLAVAEQEMKKRKLKGVSDLTLKSRNPSQRERIFRVGTIYYKMDSSRRTLLRISDENTPAVINSESVYDAKRSVVPRRLLIGNDEYIRVGNGNQLVRDPKKLVRILANEKIRWSLHTARLRSVRKQQYCQFFTRFGKCNKEDGKCPYIHDPTKVAICTKFLKGLCSSLSCKLTHKLIPERMPDCSYFLQGLCTNTTCPYRHVNVNPMASVCEGFLKGYCRDGDECQRKHSYVCPLFEASGKCPQGSACKLHHPKRATKQGNNLRKRKQSRSHDHGRGRYFGCSVDEVSKPQVFVSNMHAQMDEDAFYRDGRFAEYISLDVNNKDDVVEANDPMYSHPILTDSDLSDSLSSDADALIKPIRIMSMDPR